ADIGVGRHGLRLFRSGEPVDVEAGGKLGLDQGPGEGGEDGFHAASLTALPAFVIPAAMPPACAGGMTSAVALAVALTARAGGLAGLRRGAAPARTIAAVTRAARGRRGAGRGRGRRSRSGAVTIAVSAVPVTVAVAVIV